MKGIQEPFGLPLEFFYKSKKYFKVKLHLTKNDTCSCFSMIKKIELSQINSQLVFMDIRDIPSKEI
jgi:hypothetical protein